MNIFSSIKRDFKRRSHWSDGS